MGFKTRSSGGQDAGQRAQAAFIKLHEYADDSVRFRASYEDGRLVLLRETDAYGECQFERHFTNDGDLLQLFAGGNRLLFERRGQERLLKVEDSDGTVLLERQLRCGPVANMAALKEAIGSMVDGLVEVFDYGGMDNSFEFLAQIGGEDDMYTVRSSDEFFEDQDDKLPGADWSVVLASLDLRPWTDPMDELDDFIPEPESSSNAPKRPHSVDAAARFDAESRQWRTDECQEFRNANRLQYWSEAGEHLYYEWRDLDSGMRQAIGIYFEGGNGRLDFQTGRGELSRHQQVRSPASFYPGEHAPFPDFPGEANIAALRFRFEDGDSETLRFRVVESCYFDQNYKPIDAEGRSIEPPCWLEPKVSEEELGPEDGSYASWHDEESPHLRVKIEDGTIVYSSEHDADGKLQFERRVADGHDVLTICGEEGRFIYERAGDDRRIQVVDGDEVKFEISIACPKLGSADDFVQAFDAFYGAIAEHFELDQLENGFHMTASGFDVQCSELDRDEAAFRVATVLSNGSGDNVVVIEEPGEHQGKVFVNYHDDGGLYHIECIEDFIADNGLDLEDRAALIEEMPFFKNELTDDLTGLFAMIDIAPWEDPREDIDSLKRQED